MVIDMNNNKLKEYMDKMKVSNNNTNEYHSNFSYKQVINLTEIALLIISVIIFIIIYNKLDLNIFVFLAIALFGTGFIVFVVGKVVSTLIINILNKLKK